MSPDQFPSFFRDHGSLFEDFSLERISALCVGGRPIFLEAGETPVCIGDDADFLGVALEGELTASTPGEGGRPAELLRFRPGDTFGELGLLTGDKITADLVAATRAQILQIPVDRFWSCCCRRSPD